jgi:hypothetical protein
MVAEPVRGLIPVLRPNGRLDLRQSDDAATLAPAQAARLQYAFAGNPGHGLGALGADEVGSALLPALAYWRQLAARFITCVCTLPDIAERTGKPAVPSPSLIELAALADAAPPMLGGEYLSADVLAAPPASRKSPKSEWTTSATTGSAWATQVCATAKTGEKC